MNHKGLSSSRKSDLIFLLLIAVVALLSYSNTFHVPFQLDDTLNISSKPYVKDMGAFFDAAEIEHHRTDYPFRMRMVAYFTFAINYRIHGDAVVGYHVVNLAIHVLNGFLVYFLVLLTFKTPYIGKLETLNSKLETESRAIALFAALLFVSHPAQTQAVTYIVQRLASLATFFYLLSLVMYIRWRITQNAAPPDPESQILNPEKKKTAAGAQTPAGGELLAGRVSDLRFRISNLFSFWYLTSVISAALAMKTKEIAFTLPLMIALYEFLFFKGALKKRILFLLPLLLIMLIIPLELMGLEKPAGEVIGDVSSATRVQSNISRGDYLFTELRVIVTYIRLLIFPVNQNLDYDYPVYGSFLNPNVFLSFLFLSCIFGFGIYCVYRSRITCLPDRQTHHALRFMAFGIFWFFMTLSVESSVIPIADVIFEHRVYLPSVGFFIAVTAVLNIVWESLTNISKAWTKRVIVVFGLIVVILSGVTYARNNLWRDEIKLWEDVVRKSPSKVRPRINLGYFYGKQGRLEEAVREYQIALRLDPADFQVHNNLGVIYKAQGRIDEAIREYRLASSLNPDDAMAHYNLGNIFRERGDFEEAIKHYKAAIRLKPEIELALLHNNLGIAYIGLQNMKEAEREFRIAIDLDPGYEPARRNLEMLLGSGGERK
jgi:tetratricopeptide (TPR) repeat protein